MMTLQELLGDALILPEHLRQLTVAGLQLDSRLVKPGDVFLARQGSVTHGQAFIQQAIANGTVAVLTEDRQTQLVSEQPVPIIAVLALGQQLGNLAAKFYQTTDEPAVVGVTGTNGKTSVCHYFAAIMSACAVKTGVVGTVGNGVWPEISESSLTTPDVLTQHANLAAFRAQGVSYVAMEISSHALEQQRLAGIAVKIAVFTNLSQDHLDYHGSMEAYGAAKAKLFRLPSLTHAIINIDDSFAKTICDELASDCELITYSLTARPDAKVRVLEYSITRKGISATISTPWGEAAFAVPLLGDFTLANLLASIASSCATGLPLVQVVAALSAIKPVSGRLEWLQNPDGPQVVVDFAHTPDAIVSVLANLRQLCPGKLWCVFGCGGDRDKQKRPKMGQAAAKLADEIVLTSDNPRSEHPGAIIADIRAGIHEDACLITIEDREQAIAYAVQHASPTDWVLIAGKGHESYQEINGQRLPLSDQQIAAACMTVARETVNET